jgi:hypothetical protein
VCIPKECHFVCLILPPVYSNKCECRIRSLVQYYSLKYIPTFKLLACYKKITSNQGMLHHDKNETGTNKERVIIIISPQFNNMTSGRDKPSSKQV